MEKFKDRPLHFAYAWPVKDPKRSKRKLPPPPFPEAAPGSAQSITTGGSI